MVLGGNIAGDLNVARIFGTNINTNSQATAVDVSNYLGIFGVIFNAGAGVAGTQLALNFATGNDTNYSNSVALTSPTVPNFTTTAAQTVVGVDSRLCRKYLFVNWLIQNSGATANTFVDGTIVAQAKYKTS